ADELAHFLRDRTDSSLYSEPWYNINVNVASHERGKTWNYHIASEHDLQPKRSHWPTGSGCMAPFRDHDSTSTDFEERFAAYRQSGKNIQQASIAAFTDFVEEDPNLGGTIYSEVLRPKRNVFQQAMMN